MFYEFYEGVRLIVLAVAVQRDPIHKSHYFENCTAPFELNKCECLTMKQLSLDT